MTENSNMPTHDADRTGSDRFKEDDDETMDRQDANEHIRKTQGNDSAEPAHDDRSGNRPQFDRDR